MKRIVLLIGVFSGFLFLLNTAWANPALDDPYQAKYVLAAPQDTVPDITDRPGNSIFNNSSNPFDLNDPTAIEKTVEYDPTTGQYIVSEKIGDFYFRPPTYMSFEEYMEYRQQRDEREYFNTLSSQASGKGNSLDPLEELDLENILLDRLFGGTDVNIQPQGNIDLTFGMDYQRLENPILTERQQRQGPLFDFDMNIQMNVTGQIGEKLTLSTNYNTGATFDFDNQIKINYSGLGGGGGGPGGIGAGGLGDAIGQPGYQEDGIIKNIEAGNVSLPLRGTLIQGAQSLFGLKTELQFGNLYLTSIISQQQSEQENIRIEGGSQVQEFEVRSDEYDENRHFLLSHYNRDVFEESLENLPQIRSLFKIENIEVWITNDRNEVDNIRDIVALADLGEPVTDSTLTSPNIGVGNPRLDVTRRRFLPDNDANDLYRRIVSNENVREIDQAVSTLQSGQFGLQQSRDFEKVSARKLRPNEYTVHPQLGFVSLNINVQPDQVVGVAYQYSYNGENFKVGELSINTENTQPDSSLNVLFVKMLKSTTQRPDVPAWDLMMKNVYSIGAFNVNQKDFRLDVVYDDPGKGQKRFLPNAGDLTGFPLLRVFNLDQLNIQGDPQPDGVFDFVPGLTINLQNGRVMFPVLEPFGSSLAQELEPQFRDQYVYQELYDSTLFLAREFPEKNRFTILGEYKSAVTSEISLGAFNIPEGSVRVTAGGQVLKEGRDYEIDYNIGRLRILNDAILSSGVPVNVSFEDNTLFGFQTKTMMGVRADYRISDDFNLGATWLKLFERPFTQKVNIGDDPINNSIYGLDVTLNKEAPWLTRAVDAIPGLSTKAPSSIDFSAEFAALKPGHSRAINQTRQDEGGVVYLDDFEGAASTFDLRQPTLNWFLASTPQNDAENNNPKFPESSLVNDRRNAANRAKLSWYRIDQNIRSEEDRQNPYTAQIPQTEVFPNVQIPANQLPNIQTLDLSYFPSERGPYNFDVPNGYPGFTDGVEIIGNELQLRNPRSRWAGIMRAMNNNDFQSANIEFLEFWMLSPFLDPENPEAPAPDYQEKEGTLYINFGNISEDIQRDSRKFFENGLPGPTNPNRRVDTTNLSVVPVGQQITRAFDNDEANRAAQDIGLDGLDDESERLKFRDYLNEVAAANPAFVQDVLSNDPAGDNFRYFRDPSFGPGDGILTRYRDFNNPQGNSQANSGGNVLNSATNIPDNEDMDNDNTLNETESYFEYSIPLRANPANPREIDQNRTPFITDQISSPDGSRVWYRFRIPLRGKEKRSVGGIRDFRSIRFMRMYMNEFESPVTLRFARLELVRNQWRQYTKDLSTEPNPVPCDALTTMDVDAVNIEENSNREPFNYTLPKDIQREQSLGVFNTLQNEQSLNMVINGLCEGEEKAVFKNLDMDFRVYERIKMFVHAEELEGPNVEDGDLSIFIRLGTDFVNNYYEYEIPLVLSNPDSLEGLPQEDSYKLEVWKPENEFDFPLELLKDLKLERNAAGFSVTDEYVRELENQGKRFNDIVRVKGNPNYGMVRSVMVGVRNREGGQANAVNAEVWINELRLTGLDERGGVAAVGRLDMQLADFGSLTLAGNFSSIGFGALDQKVQERSREDVIGYDLAANLELGKFFPDRWGLRLPFYGQLSRTIRTPEFDPYDLDVRVEEKLDNAESSFERDSIRNTVQERVNIKSFNLTNVGKQATGRGKKPRPWDIENVSVSYSYTETERSDPLIESDLQQEYTGGLDYQFSRQVKYIEPFKFIKARPLQIISQFNFNPLPNSFNFSTILDREFTTTKYRFTGLEDRFSTFYINRFSWDRNYDLQWDLTKSLNITYAATNRGVIDEPNVSEILDRDPSAPLEEIRRIRKDSIWEGIRDFGRTKNFRHSLSVNYTLPIQYLPLMDWVQARAQYRADYSWSAAALNVDSLGNVIQNSQDMQFNLDMNFERLYNKIPYLSKINRGSGGSRGGRPGGGRPGGRPGGQDQGDDGGNDRRRTGPSGIEKALIRPLMALRSARFNYSEKWGTVIPSFLPQSQLLGSSADLSAPGMDFIFGYQPRIRQLNPGEYYTDRDWLHQAAEKGWLSRSVWVNQEVIQTFTQEYDARITLEPFNEFRVEIDARRRYIEDHSEFFKDTIGNREQLYHAVPKDFGQLEMTYSALNTLFQDGRDEIIDLFTTFEQNRAIISQRIGGADPHADSLLAVQGYRDGYGRTQQDVLVPAFLAAYTGQDPNQVRTSVFDLLPDFNWNLTYNGLSRIPLFADLFRNFSLRHGYKSNLTINSFNTGLDYLRTVNLNNGVNELNQNFYPRLEIPELVISEGFQPLIAVDATLNNGMSFNVDYKKTRTLAMSFVSNQLSESQSKEIVIGFGYLFRNLDIPFLTGSAKGGGRRRPAPQPGATGQSGGGSRGQLDGQDLDISFDFRLTDDVTFNHLLDQGIVEPTRGNYSLSISPAAEYQVNQRLSLRLFFDYRRVEPKTSAGYPRTDSSGGVVVRFSLN
ncbi:MAG TPA: cell surface protein SprA [Saprospiraceae bacterium]|nr:cell surface protein SprA [Saprospiraceae bacterium]